MSVGEGEGDRVRGALTLHARAVAQSGSALVWGTRGRRFKSGQPDQFVDCQHHHDRSILGTIGQERRIVSTLDSAVFAGLEPRSDSR